MEPDHKKGEARDGEDEAGLNGCSYGMRPG